MENELVLPELQMTDAIVIHEVMAVTSRLADVLRRESDFLKQMNIGEAGKLQDEKIKLTAWLEAQKKLIAIRPELRDQISPQEREELEAIIEDFTDAMEENFRQVSIARVVNQKVVQAITESMREQQQLNTYNAYGTNTSRMSSAALSYNLNQKA